MTLPPLGIVQDGPAQELMLAAVRDLYSRLPETYFLQHVLFSLGYTDDLADEAEIAAAVEVARQDWPKWGPAA
jgi:hypothetical protein